MSRDLNAASTVRASTAPTGSSRGTETLGLADALALADALGPAGVAVLLVGLPGGVPAAVSEVQADVVSTIRARSD
ncbi:hypothetical protein AB4089_05705 [Arthrobacter sp. 2MCAF15]|uniref:hypothetical protein n=1 Tax=Arthrobacter sp. 2MCAF15 TaxID=3232984 RepID=UPI003F93DB08